MMYFRHVLFNHHVGMFYLDAQISAYRCNELHSVSSTNRNQTNIHIVNHNNQLL